MRCHRVLPLLTVAVIFSGCSKDLTAPAVPNMSRPPTAAAAKVSAATGPIMWSQRRQLSWADYRGVPDPSSPFLALSTVGSTRVVRVDRSPAGQVTIVGAETIFDPDRSWVEPAGQSDALLHHEQGHFDLEESVTRDFRAAIEIAAKTQDGAQLLATVTKLTARFSRRSHDLHDHYDKDTNHGQDLAAQMRWDRRILRLLAEPSVFRDDFGGPTLADGWRWVREDAAAWSLTGGYLSIAMEYGDLWQNWTNNCRNLLLRNAPIDDTYAVETRLNASLVANINQALIVVYGDDDNYVRFGLINVGGQLYVNHVHEIAAATQPQAHTPYSSGDVYLRVIKSGASAVLQYSADGSTWSTHATITSLGFAVSAVGLVAFDGSEPASASAARYDYFQISRGTP